MFHPQGFHSGRKWVPFIWKKKLFAQTSSIDRTNTISRAALFYFIFRLGLITFLTELLRLMAMLDHHQIKLKSCQRWRLRNSVGATFRTGNTLKCSPRKNDRLKSKDPHTDTIPTLMEKPFREFSHCLFFFFCTVKKTNQTPAKKPNWGKQEVSVVFSFSNSAAKPTLRLNKTTQLSHRASQRVCPQSDLSNIDAQTLSVARFPQHLCVSTPTCCSSVLASSHEKKGIKNTWKCFCKVAVAFQR